MTKTDSGVEVGRLNERVEVLELRNVSELDTQDDVPAPKQWEWEAVRRTWAKADLMAKTNIYSVHALGAAGVSFIIRRQGITLDNALCWRGQHCLITSIRPLGRLYLTVEAALVVLSQCRNPETGDTFPAVMTERYVGYQQLEPMAANKYRRVMVTPKAVRLTSGPLVEVDGVEWPVTAPYEMDPHKNEYAIERDVDL